jgi:predicted mannosyl-3-phosphoglycerate phosphatase (HAD superfamily)
MSLDDLRSQFVIDDNVRSEKLETLIQKALPNCVVRKNGSVEIKRTDLSGKQSVKLVLSARLLASKVDDTVAAEVTVEQLAEYTGLPKDQAAARAKECLDERFSERSSRGSYKARLIRVEEFLDSLSQHRGAKATA